MAKNSGVSSASSSSMELLLIEDIDFVQVEEQGLSHWELVNASDADSEKEQEQEQEEEEIEDSIGNEIGSLGSEISLPGYLNDAQIESPRVDLHDYGGDVKYDGGYYGYGYGYGNGGHGEEQHEEEDEDEDDDNGDDGSGLDDELVPWDVSDKVGRQRMRKLGKRVFSKMNNSKRSPYLFLRPGCVRGKHGLGLKYKC